MQTIEFVPAPIKRPQELFLQVGRKRYQVASIGEAVEMYEKARDASEQGASQMPQVKIVAADGFFLYGIAYNGRVWELGKDGSQVFLDGMSSAEWVRHATGDSSNG